MLYLDFAASTPVRPGALEILIRSMTEDFANPSSAHILGRTLGKRIETCRHDFLDFLGAQTNDHLIFTGSATESNNTLIEGLDFKESDTVMVSFADHPSVTAPAFHLKKRNIETKEIPLRPDGAPDEEAFLKLVDEHVKLVVLSHVNNQSGTITDVCGLSREIKKINRGAHIHVDAAQGFGKIPFSLKDGQIDSLCVSSHKIGGPKGAAVLYLRSGIKLSPLLYGGEQENGFRSSTQAAPLIFSFCEAARESIETIESSLAHVDKINRIAQRLLKEKIDAVEFPFSSLSSPYILTFLLPGVSSDIILRSLEQKGIFISSSSACSSKIKGDNPVFTALHLPPQTHKFVLRASFSHDTTETDVETFCNSLASVYNNISYLIR